MAIDYSQLAIPKSQPRALSKAQKAAAEATALRECYAAVDQRDKRICRATGRPVVPGAVHPAMRLERHHLEKRSLAKGRADDPANVVTLCAEAHQLVEAHALEIEGTNADARLVFHWNRRMVKKGAEPFKLLSKRWSQRRDD